MKGLGSYMALPQTPLSLSALNKRLTRNVVISFVTFFLLMCVLWRQSRPKDDSLPQQLYPEREDYEYFTSSNFYPVSIPDATKKTTEELCKSFPKHVLSRIQPVLKTGHGDSKERVDSQMDSVSSCFTPEELLLFSDIDERIRNHTTIDILSYLPESHYNETIFKSWAPYVEQKRRKILGTLDSPNQERIDGWKLDKFKFLPIIEQAWAMRPNKEFYVFYEMDTYISWDNMFRMLDTYDPDANIYMGSPSPGRRDAQRHDQGTWFGNGGPGYVLSRGAMKTILNRQVGPHGRYIDSSLSTQFSELTQDAECCGDSVLGYVLWLKKIPMHGLYPMFTPFILPDIPFTEENWCYPLITLHKNTPKEMVDLFKWEFEKRKQQTPLLLADVWDFYRPGSVSTKPNWENGHFNKYDPPNMEEVNTVEKCSKACENDPVCLEWTFYGKEHKRCSLQSSIQNGGPREPGRLEDKDIDWTAGWMTDRIARWKTEKQCYKPKWPGASVRRVF